MANHGKSAEIGHFIEMKPPYSHTIVPQTELGASQIRLNLRFSRLAVTDMLASLTGSR